MKIQLKFINLTVKIINLTYVLDLIITYLYRMIKFRNSRRSMCCIMNNFIIVIAVEKGVLVLMSSMNSDIYNSMEEMHIIDAEDFT